jgi:hypothetical protein
MELEAKQMAGDRWLAGWLAGWVSVVGGMHVGGKQGGWRQTTFANVGAVIVTFMKQKQCYQLLSQWWVADSFWQAGRNKKCQAQSKTPVRLPHES